jgi:hypothetical protein
MRLSMETECSCPYCGEPIALWVDEGGGTSQSYVEDCAVCWRPMQVYISIDGDGEASANVGRGDD